jgi:diketogulonate reductase-like aldo/keto reductase
MKSVPAVFYGTAWKKERTAELVALALKCGFRAIDTACQPKHYHEAGVGEGIAKSGLPREQLFLQTKYTPIGGQDANNVPYNPKDDIKTQVRTSLQVSLKNLRTEYLDSLVLHSPMSELGKTVEVWRVFEEFVKDGKVKSLGISNCYNLDLFAKLYETAEVKPSYLQNRFYAQSGYDR